jgi:hypothetical protein
MLFYKEHKDETKCLECGKSRFVKVINKDGENVTTKVSHKQLRYMPLTPHETVVSQRKLLDTRGGIRNVYVRTIK